MPKSSIHSEESNLPRRVDLLLIYGLLSLGLLCLGGWLTWLGLGPWYKQLTFPVFQPPSWLFTPVWTIVLTLLAIATWEVNRREGSRPGVGSALGLYGAQSVLNGGWSLLFFTMQRPDVALWLLFALDSVLLLMIFAYSRVLKRAGLLLVPYFVWLLFATAINFAILRLNPSLTLNV